MSDIYAHHHLIDGPGTVWLRNAERWLSPPTRATISRPARGETMTTTYEGRRVETEWGPGTIAELTGRSVTIELDLVETDLIPEGSHPRINIVRGTHGWDRFVETNREALS